MTESERARLAAALNRGFRDPYPPDMEKVRKGLIAWRARHVAEVVAEEMGWALQVADEFVAGVMAGIDQTVIQDDQAEFKLT